MKLFPYIHPKLTAFLEVASRKEAICSLIDCVDGLGLLQDKELFHRAIFDREEILSTAIGMGVAIPHARHEMLKDFFIAIGILKKGGIEDWNPLDQLPVRLIFLVGGPLDEQMRYLKLLSKLTLHIKQNEMRKKLLTCSSEREVLKLFENT